MTTRKKKSNQLRSKPGVGAPALASAKGPQHLRKLSTILRRRIAGADDLTVEQRKLIVRQALILIEQNYAHLPLKRAMHSIDPVQRLKLLLQTLELAPDAIQPAEVEFHGELTDIFTSVRDLHTNYLLPSPYDQMTAFLPFMVEDYFDGGQRKYLVSHVAQNFSHPTFVPGVEVVYWNSMPIERAVWRNAQRYAGSNREARHARGVQTLTARALRIAPPPDEEWVVVGYKTAAGDLAELRMDWQVNSHLPAGMDPSARGDSTAASLGFDLEQDIIQRLRLALFAPHVVVAVKKAAKKAARGAAFGGLESMLPNVFEARPVTTPAGMFGYVRIRTFNHFPPEDFVNEFIRLIAALPQRGLILDVRGNGGGTIMNGELILQTLTPRLIEPEPFQFINTPLNLEICRHNGPSSAWADLSVWVESMQQALQTGATFSAGFPISDPQQCNATGQKYFGPVVLITDALCYSATDIFAAGFQDHEIGPILGVDGNTGAGGANVWEQSNFVSDVLPGSVYQELPNGAGMRVSIRRTLRVGRRAGAPVEDLGVIPDKRHYLTRNDLLNKNVDLINEAGSLLVADGPVRGLTVTVQSTSPSQASIVAATQGMTRLDIYIGDRPLRSIDLKDGQVTITIPKTDSAQLNLELRGYDGARLVARYRTGV